MKQFQLCRKTVAVLATGAVAALGGGTAFASSSERGAGDSAKRPSHSGEHSAKQRSHPAEHSAKQRSHPAEHSAKQR
jgi:hypothetical protein